MNSSQYVKSEEVVKLNKEKFLKIISEYYQKNYNINVIFDFLPMIYEYIDERLVYDYSLENDIILSKKKTVNAYLPCLIEKNSYEYYKSRNIVISGIIKIDNLDEEIKKVLPREIIRIHNLEIENIFRVLGYSRPLYNWFYDSKAKVHDYNVILKKIDEPSKTKVLEY